MNKIKDYYIYNQSNLPNDGWLQGCFTCGKITGDYYQEEIKRYYLNKFRIKVYMCSKCRDELKYDDFYEDYMYYYNESIKRIFR